MLRAVGVEVLFENVTKIYSGARDTRALDGISLKIEAGEFVAVVGPSGCGKSTLLHLSGGIDTATSGRVVVGARNLALLPERELTLYRRRRVGTVFQFFNLIPALTVRENVELPLALDESREAPARARELLERVGLSEKGSAYPYELSGGEMQRVAVARALSSRPPLLLADEPTGNLDSAAGASVLDLIDSLCRDEAVTVVLATHSPEAASRANRIVRLRDGRIA
jgi:putative ABC transport system ATP-binding protein